MKGLFMTADDNVSNRFEAVRARLRDTQAERAAEAERAAAAHAQEVAALRSHAAHAADAAAVQKAAAQAEATAAAEAGGRGGSMAAVTTIGTASAQWPPLWWPAPPFLFFFL